MIVSRVVRGFVLGRRRTASTFKTRLVQNKDASVNARWCGIFVKTIPPFPDEDNPSQRCR